MIFQETELKGAYLIELEENRDERGFFARSFCEKEFLDHGISFKPVQANLSYNKRSNTLRGMHYQKSPYEEAKLVRCIQGSIFDVIIDLRDESPTKDRWFGVELNQENRKSLYVPKGFAHGFLTLEPSTEVSYLMSDFYLPGKGRGIRWDDPFYDIQWPDKVLSISEKDKTWPFVNY
jgi:dTDP-4-dehydrorhamnose 3,5-epimerase